MSENSVKMEVQALPENISVVRLTASGLASKMGFDLEAIEDIKVCISEACTNAIRHSDEKIFHVEFSVFEDNINIKVYDNGKGYDVSSVPEPDFGDPKENGLGLFIIKTLMDEVEITSDDSGTCICMVKYIGDSFYE